MSFQPATEQEAPPTLLAVDLGKTSCRVRVTRGAEVLGESTGEGAPGLAEDNGAALSHRAILNAVERLGAIERHNAVEPLGAIAGPDKKLLTSIESIGIGAAGVEAAPDAARELIRSLREASGTPTTTPFAAPIALISDGLAAHAGACGGGAGTVLIAGTGAVVFTVDGAGKVRQIDGWGPWLGDEGSGRWIGQCGLQAALRASDGRGPKTALLGDAAKLAGGLAELPRWTSAMGAPAKALGTFAPTVIARAADGDEVATGIVDEACRLLAIACVAASDDAGEVRVTGGLASQPHFRARLDSALHSSGLTTIPPLGDALSGAMLVAGGRRLPYEGRVIRG